MNSQWSISDCISFAFPDETRPEWLSECKTEAQAAEIATQKYGSVECAFVRGLTDRGYEEMPGTCRRQFDDRVVGRDALRGVTIAVTDRHYCDIIRTHTGFLVADWRDPPRRFRQCRKRL